MHSLKNLKNLGNEVGGFFKKQGLMSLIATPIIINIALSQDLNSNTTPSNNHSNNLSDSLIAQEFNPKYELTQEEIDLIEEGYHFLTNTNGYSSAFLINDPRLKKISEEEGKTLEKYENMYKLVLKEEFEKRGFQDVLILPHLSPHNYTCFFGVFYKSKIEK